MENIVETYASVPIYMDDDKDFGLFYILCRDRNGDEHRIYSPYIQVLKRKITMSLKYDNLKWGGEYAYVYF